MWHKNLCLRETLGGQVFKLADMLGYQEGAVIS
jgi:hypothetical protein